MDSRSRAEAICASLPEPTRARAVELAENVLWMEGKLANAREVIGKSSVAIPYDNGGGQRGIRKNPAFDGYNSLMSSYTKSRPSRARGLKHQAERLRRQLQHVAPFTGAWVETTLW